jgi:hypothetical protein
VSTPEEYHWSSARAHMDGNDDALVTVKPLLELGGNCSSFSAVTYLTMNMSSCSGMNGRDDLWAANNLWNSFERILIPQKGGRPKKIRYTYHGCHQISPRYPDFSYYEPVIASTVWKPTPKVD